MNHKLKKVFGIYWNYRGWIHVELKCKKNVCLVLVAHCQQTWMNTAWSCLSASIYAYISKTCFAHRWYFRVAVLQQKDSLSPCTVYITLEWSRTSSGFLFKPHLGMSLYSKCYLYLSFLLVIQPGEHLCWNCWRKWKSKRLADYV